MPRLLPLRNAPLAGYSALIERYRLAVHPPDALFAIGDKHSIQHERGWTLMTPRHAPTDDLHGHLVFALKYEGVQPDILNALFHAIAGDEITAMVRAQPTSAYSRRIWFLYEWLRQDTLPLDNTRKGNYVDLVDSSQQFTGPIRKNRRCRINNNLPGVRDFCPMVRKTPELEQWLARDLAARAQQATRECHPDLLARAASFLLLADSRASYAIEGEHPPHTRIERWGRLLGQAGAQPLSVELLEHLQSQVLGDYRFVLPGLRHEGGFVGMHDRTTGMPLPEHISAKADDLPLLMRGLIDAHELLRDSDYPQVLLAAVIAFGFVFIHPFEDGNGRLHRYLIHHVLAETGFVPRGLVFPVSAVILERIQQYHAVLEAFSKPRLDYIDWHATPRNNVAVTNDTLDLYRYFDATRQAEFLYGCVAHTVEHMLPEEVAYLQKHDAFVAFVESRLDMPSRLIDLLIRFLNQNNGVLSKRARNKEFAALTDAEARDLEERYQQIFMINA
jgi:hypothetical protein